MTFLRVESCLMSLWLARVGHGWDYTYYLDYPMIDLKLLFPSFIFFTWEKARLVGGPNIVG